MRFALLMLLAVATLGAAPVQCGDPEPIRYARRDDPAEVVYALGRRLEARGEHRAARETWRFVVERYPSSRWAERARIDLEAAGGGPDAGVEP